MSLEQGLVSHIKMSLEERCGMAACWELIASMKAEAKISLEQIGAFLEASDEV